MADNLKKGWTRVAFGDVARQVRDRVDPEKTDLERYVAGEHMDTDDLRIRRWGVVGDGYLGPAFTMRFKPGHVLYGSRRTYLRKVAVAEFEGVTANTTFVIETKDPKVLLPELLPFIMQTESFHEHSIKQSKGSVNPYINFSDLTWYEFALPPMEEQRRIVEVLAASDSCGEALRCAADRLKLLRRTSIDTFTGNGEGPRTTIGNLCEMQNGSPFPGASYGEVGIRLLRPGNMGQAGALAWHPSKTTYLPTMWEQQASDFVIDAGDVVMNLTAQSLEDGFMGRVCLAREGDRSLLNQRIGRFRDWAKGVVPEYVYRVFQSSRFQHHAIEMCEGSKVKHIFWPYIARFQLGLPTREEQERVVLRLRTVDAMLARATERATEHRRLNDQVMAMSLESSGVACAPQPMGRTRR